MGAFKSLQVRELLPLQRVIQAASTEPRSEIIELLAAGELDVSSIADRLELAIGTISHHLAILKRHHLVQMQSTGTRHTFRLTRTVRARRKGSILRVQIECAHGERAVLVRRIALSGA